eukprot:SAG25_NODE_382_length_8794_cov_3.620012_3_plen_78_part_00
MSGCLPVQEEAAASERCSGVLSKLGRSKEVPLLRGEDAVGKAETALEELIDVLLRSPAPVKISVARYVSGAPGAVRC